MEASICGAFFLLPAIWIALRPEFHTGPESLNRLRAFQAKRGADACHHRLIVAAQHHGLHAHSLQPRDGCRRGRAKRVGQCKEARQSTIDRYMGKRCTTRRHIRMACVGRTGIDLRLTHHLRVADDKIMLAHAGQDAAPGPAFEVADGGPTT